METVKTVSTLHHMLDNTVYRKESFPRNESDTKNLQRS